MSPKKDITLSLSISKNIKKLRVKTYRKHGGQSHCAEDFGVSSQMWSNWETGRNIPSEAYQRKLALFFGISVAELRGELPAGYKKTVPADAGTDTVAQSPDAFLRLHATLTATQRILLDLGNEAALGNIDPDAIFPEVAEVLNKLLLVRGRPRKSDTSADNNSDNQNIDTGA